MALARLANIAMTRTALAHQQTAQRLQALHSTAVLTLVSEIVAQDQRELRAALGELSVGDLQHRLNEINQQPRASALNWQSLRFRQ